MTLGFWDKHVGQPQQPAPQPQQAPQQPSRPWWQTHNPAPAPEPTPEPETPAGDISVKQEGLFTGGPKAVQNNAKHEKDGYCPECQGPNYVTVGRQANQSGSFAVQRCYDCGYPIQQQFSGISGAISDGGPSQPARQLSTSNNYNPGQIVDRIG